MNSAIPDIPKKLFITGTDTGIGKTVVSALLCSGLSAGYWKPVQAGLEPVTDSEQIRLWSGLSEDHFYPERYRLKMPASPHLAAQKENISIELSDFKLPDFRQEHLIVEGAGGLIVPLNNRDTIIDLIKLLQLPVLLVCRSSLGTINHTLLSIRALQSESINIYGVVMNGPTHRSNELAIQHFGGIERLFRLSPFTNLKPDGFVQQFNETFNVNHAS